MNCWHCNSKLIWKNDFSFEDYGIEGEGVVADLSCPKCPTDVQVYYKISEEE